MGFYANHEMMIEICERKCPWLRHLIIECLGVTGKKAFSHRIFLWRDAMLQYGTKILLEVVSCLTCAVLEIMDCNSTSHSSNIELHVGNRRCKPDQP